MRRSIGISFVVGIVGGLTACAAANGPAVSAELQTIAASYLELVTPLNDANCTFSAVLLVPNATLDDLKQGAADDAVSLRTFADSTRAIEWPPEITRDARDLIDAVAINQAAAQAAAEAPTLAAFNSAFRDISAANAASTRAASVVRSDLGLSGASGDPCKSFESGAPHRRHRSLAVGCRAQDRKTVELHHSVRRQS